jgi:uncharacterized membrane-anchored protein
MKRPLVTALVALAQLALVGVGVAPQLSARLRGDTYVVRVAALDPIDPFRGAYVALDYPDLRRGASTGGSLGGSDDGRSGALYISLRPEGELWVADDWSRTRPADGPYLACEDRGWEIRCGIESWFLPQDEAAATERALRGGGAVAELRVDDRGNAAVVDVREGP